MDAETFKRRTKLLAVRVIKIVDSLPKTLAGQVLGQQVLRSATSIAANYRAACLAQSTADMIKKLKIVEEATDETLLWLELRIEAKIVPETKLTDLIDEAREILKMVIASIKTLRTKSLTKRTTTNAEPAR
jgi:four helix bundle protein